MAGVESKQKEAGQFYKHPLSGKINYDIPGGSKVKLYLHDGDVHKGIIFKNPKYDGGKTIRLLQAIRVGVDKRAIPGVQYYAENELHRSQ